MGDRIKFGPEWLRNLAPGTSGSNNQNAAMPSSTNPSGGASGGPSGDNTVSSSTSGNIDTGNTSNINSTNTPSKVLLAKLRYGREEMLALYDRTSDAPPELKVVDILYQPRGKPPFALNNSFDDDMRDNMRSGPPIGVVSPGERFGLGRGMGRGLNIRDGRGSPRVPFVRQPSTGRGTTWHHGIPKMPGYSGGADDDSTLNLRSSWSASNGPNTPNRTAGEQAEWTPNKMFRSKRQGQATNWRQSREEGEEWRSPDGGRSRNNQQEKWERDWGDRPSQDKQQSWNSNRRWVGGDTQNEENLPEWAVDSAEACGGTFDSSGAFHGYSNDDTNLPKNQDTSYTLTRSHTHGSFARSRTVEEGSDDWWSSEKAKKLSPKRFEASDVKFKKQTSAPETSDTGTDATKAGKDIDQQEIGTRKPLRDLESLESLTSEDVRDNASGGISDDEKFNKKTRDIYKPKFSESNTFDALMRSDINLEEANDERGNFQSVMITPNNSLRQKHQNIVSSASEMPMRDSNSSKQGLLQLIQGSSSHQSIENEIRKHQSSEEKIVDEIFEMTLEEKDLMTKSKQISSTLGNNKATSTTSPMTSIPQMPNSAMQLRLSSPGFANSALMSAKPNMPTGMQGIPTGLQGHPSGLQGLPAGMQGLPAGIQIGGLPPSLQVAGMQPLGMQGPGQPQGMQGGMQSGIQPLGMQGPGQPQGMQSGMQQSMQGSGMQGPGMQSSGLQAGGLQPGMQPGMQGSMQPLQSVGITNSALNASLGLPIAPGSNTMGIPMQGVPTPVMPSSGMGNPGMVGGLQGAMGGGQMQPGGAGMAGFPNAAGIPGMSSANTSLFLSQNSNNPSMGNSSDIPMPNHGNHSNMYQMHGLQQSGSQSAFGSSIYSNIMQQQPTQPPPNHISEQWYYEDPEKNIQGPFSSKDMYNWYRAGFFNPSLMVRRACDTHMRPLGSYGPVVPFSQIDIVSFPLSSGFDRSPGPHESMLNSQQGLGLENVMNMSNLNDAPTVNSMQFGSVRLVTNPPFGQQQQMVDSLWSQPSPSAEMLWMQQAMSRNDNRVNNLPMFFWEQQPSAIASNALLPEEIAKEMKTEDQILAQLRVSQNIGTSQNVSFIGDQTAAGTDAKPDDAYPTPSSATPNMEELQKLIKRDSLQAKPVETTAETIEIQHKSEKTAKVEQITEVSNQKIQQHQSQETQHHLQPQQQQPTKPATESKQVKQAKNECEKASKTKENNTKTKNKKKDEKKDDLDSKTKEDDNARPEKRSDEPSPTKTKKEDKANKKELEKEKKEWLKEGFTIVKGSEKSTNKDNKKKADEAKAVEEAERKRKEDEKLAADEDKKRKQAEATRKQQEGQQQQQQKQAVESVVKKAPWSAVSNQSMFATNKDGLTLTEIQRLEREKKLEQIKEQQQMMQIIAQQQAAALAREQEMQAGLGWAKKKGSHVNAPGQSLSEIQAEARKQSAAAAAAVAAAAAAQAIEDTAQPPVMNVPWGNPPNGGGFWDTQPNQPSKSTDRPQESPKPAEPKPKKKITVHATPKKETSPAVEFESWCTTVLTSWSSKIDVPTFVGFLKDIESPYEVKDYVKCYLGESKDSNDFSRQFLERRSKLLRVGMVTPSDDLCSPAMAVNPRTTSGSDYQEVKGKGKKTKKNKMLKVDARILGFSVTAAEDRINVGDIDSV